MQGVLFDMPEMARDATFFGPYRIKLSRDWGDGPRALVVGCNPSAANALSDDPTSRWWNAWFKQAGFGGYDAANLYPFCTSSPVECRAIVEADSEETRHALYEVNLPALTELSKTASQVFLCWGAIAWDDAWISNVCREILRVRSQEPTLWCWGKTKTGAPKHPLARGKHRIQSTQAAIPWVPVR
jgi:hypothetical protein